MTPPPLPLQPLLPSVAAFQSVTSLNAEYAFMALRLAHAEPPFNIISVIFSLLLFGFSLIQQKEQSVQVNLGNFYSFIQAFISLIDTLKKYNVI